MFEARAAGRGIQGGVGPLEAARSSESWFRNGVTFDLFLHLPPLSTSQHEVHMLSGDVFTQGLLMDAEICRELTRGVCVCVNQSFDTAVFVLSALTALKGQLK